MILHPATSAFPSYPWYAVVNPADFQSNENLEEHKTHILEQGDILEDFERFTLLDVTDPQVKEQYPDVPYPMDLVRHNLIVMTQSCDLVQGKTELVAVCEVLLQEDFEPNEPIAKKDGLSNCRKGAYAHYFLLDQCRLTGHERPFRIVDFGAIHSLPIRNTLKFLVTKSHLRLLPPYRERLSQDFARFFMRIGLPQDITLPSDDAKPKTNACNLCMQFQRIAQLG
jgi:hypothetical protein